MNVIEFGRIRRPPLQFLDLKRLGAASRSIESDIHTTFELRDVNDNC